MYQVVSVCARLCMYVIGCVCVLCCVWMCHIVSVCVMLCQYVLGYVCVFQVVYVCMLHHLCEYQVVSVYHAELHGNISVDI